MNMLFCDKAAPFFHVFHPKDLKAIGDKCFSHFLFLCIDNTGSDVETAFFQVRANHAGKRNDHICQNVGNDNVVAGAGFYFQE